VNELTDCLSKGNYFFGDFWMHDTIKILKDWK